MSISILYDSSALKWPKLYSFLMEVQPVNYMSSIVNTMADDDKGPLLLTWIKCNPSMDKQLDHL